MKRFFEFRRRIGIGAASALTALALAAGTRHLAQASTLTDAAPKLAARVPRLLVQDMGRAPRSTRIRIALVLNYRRTDELEALIRATSDPNSPEYGHFLSPKQFDATFAPTTADYHRATSLLAASGFTIGSAPSPSIVEASAPAATVERFFNTQIDVVRQREGAALRYANVAPGYLPTALASLTYGIAGLNNLIVAKAQNVRAASHADVVLGPPLQGPDTGLGPYALASAYDFPVQHAKTSVKGETYDGSGHAAGIAIDSDLLDSDMASFLSYFKIKRTGPALVRVPVDGGSGGVTFDSIETTLDVETIASLAPGAGIFLYLMPSLSTIDIVDTYAKVVADDKVDVLNSSFGACEIVDNLGELSDHIAQQGAAEGITFSAASGDVGAIECIGYTANSLGVLTPASSPHFTAVGATSLIITPTAAYRAEFAWNGSGGGVSTRFAEPPYQYGIAHIIEKQRNVPDIAFDGGPGTGISYFYQGAFNGPSGGSSLSCAIFSALVTELNEVSGKRSGAVNYALYAAFKKTAYATKFRDITVGNNSVGSIFPSYNAGPGYDNVTGLGSLVGWAYAI